MLVAQSYPPLCHPMDCSPPGSSVHGILPARILEWVAIPYSGIFPTQELNLGILYCRQILYPLSHQGLQCIHVFNHDTVHIIHTHINNISEKLGEIASTAERNIYIHICIYTHVYIHICMYIDTYTCMYIHTYMIGFKKIGISGTMEG